MRKPPKNIDELGPDMAAYWRRISVGGGMARSIRNFLDWLDDPRELDRLDSLIHGLKKNLEDWYNLEQAAAILPAAALADSVLAALDARHGEPAVHAGQDIIGSQRRLR